MFWRSFDSLTAEDIQELVDSETCEHARLDYKGGHPAKWKEEDERDDMDKEKLNFLKDIISMANRRGGDIVYDVHADEDTGKPNIAKGFEEEDLDALERELTDLIRQYIEPAIAVQIRELEREEDLPLLVVRVPDSWRKPHAVHMDRRWTYFMRIGKANRPCELEDIRQMYTGWQGIEEKLEVFRGQRLKALAGDRGPVKLAHRKDGESKRYVLIHIVPVGNFAREVQLDVREQDGEPTNWLCPPDASGSDKARYTSMGRVEFSGRREEQRIRRPTAYVMWMRNGGIEACYAERGDQAHPDEVTDALKRSVQRWKEGLDHHEVDGPFYVAVSLFLWKGNMVLSDDLGVDWEINEDVIRVPHVVVDSLESLNDGERENSLEAVYDYLWESLGLARPRE